MTFTEEQKDILEELCVDRHYFINNIEGQCDDLYWIIIGDQIKLTTTIHTVNNLSLIPNEISFNHEYVNFEQLIEIIKNTPKIETGPWII